MGFIKRKFTRLDFGNYEFKKFQRELLEKNFWITLYPLIGNIFGMI